MQLKLLNIQNESLNHNIHCHLNKIDVLCLRHITTGFPQLLDINVEIIDTAGQRHGGLKTAVIIVLDLE